MCETRMTAGGALCWYPVFTTPTQALEWAAPDSEIQSMSYYRGYQGWHQKRNRMLYWGMDAPILEHDLGDPCSFEWEDAMARQGLSNTYSRSQDPVSATPTQYDNEFDTDSKTGSCTYCQSNFYTSLNNRGPIKHMGYGSGQDKSFYMPKRLKMNHAEFCDKYGCMCQNNEFCSLDGQCGNHCTNDNQGGDPDNYDQSPGKYYGETNQLCPQKAIDEGRVLNYRQYVSGRPFTNAIGAQGFGTSTPGGPHGKRQYCMTQRPTPKSDGTGTEYKGWVDTSYIGIAKLVENYP